MYRAGPYAAFLGSAYNPIWTTFRGTATARITKTLNADKVEFAEPYVGISANSRFEIGTGEGRPDEVVILYEAFTTFRQVFMDGRALPEDPQPAWNGYSVGRWDGDALVIETAGFNDLTWLDNAGTPHSEALHVTERFHRRDIGHLDIQITVDDPKTFLHPFTVTEHEHLLPDTGLLEMICSENNKDLKHLVGE